MSFLNSELVYLTIYPNRLNFQMLNFHFMYLMLKPFKIIIISLFPLLIYLIYQFILN